MESVAIKPRLDNVIVGIHFTDGAYVKQGDLLVTLDSRALEAQIAQSEANLARNQAHVRADIKLSGRPGQGLMIQSHAHAAIDHDTIP